MSTFLLSLFFFCCCYLAGSIPSSDLVKRPIKDYVVEKRTEIQNLFSVLRCHINYLKIGFVSR